MLGHATCYKYCSFNCARAVRAFGMHRGFHASFAFVYKHFQCSTVTLLVQPRASVRVALWSDAQQARSDRELFALTDARSAVARFGSAFASNTAVRVLAGYCSSSNKFNAASASFNVWRKACSHCPRSNLQTRFAVSPNGQCKAHAQRAHPAAMSTSTLAGSIGGSSSEGCVGCVGETRSAKRGGQRTSCITGGGEGTALAMVWTAADVTVGAATAAEAASD